MSGLKNMNESICGHTHIYRTKCKATHFDIHIVYTLNN